MNKACRYCRVSCSWFGHTGSSNCETQTCLIRAPLALIRGLIMVFYHPITYSFCWVGLLYWHRVTRMATVGWGASQWTYLSFRVLSLLIGLMSSYNLSSITVHSEGDFNNLHAGCHGLMAFRSEAELFTSPWEMDTYRRLAPEIDKQLIFHSNADF